MKEVKLIIIEDHTMVREMWKILLTPARGFIILADCGGVTEAKKIITQMKADVIMLDINLAGDSGFDLIPDIMHYAPGTKLLVVSMHSLASYAKKAMRMGASGYVTKNSTNDELVDAIREVANGKKYICKEVAALMSGDAPPAGDDSPDINNLSSREIEIVQFIKKGKSSKEIAETLDLSLRTVEAHRYNILHKLKLKNTASLISYISKTDIGI
ncbi:MAG: response regulator transcription factor [Sphingobacteriales bacterium]|nr:response regulator transcription factor [Sphingobacteriales bacterium]MBI3717834.1 response regulator transcription factor [Sphingobacteriales bacterium]